MFKTKVIKLDSFVSKAGKPCKMVWFYDEDGVPTRTWVSSDFNAVKGDEINVFVKSSSTLMARIEVVKS